MKSVKQSGALVKSLILITSLVLTIGLLPAAAGAQTFQRVPFASAPNPVGSGARATAWGGSFIAVSDDATAASWNPAGLVQLITPEASVALSYHTRTEDFNFGGDYDASSETHISTMANINYASAVYPFHVGEVNMAASINYQRLFEFDRNLSYTTSGVNSLGYDFTEEQKLQQSGALTTVTPAFAIQITPYWSVGVAVNFWGLDGAGDGWEQQWQVAERAMVPGDPLTLTKSWYETKETYNISGVNYVIGTHVKVQSLTIGLVYKTSWVADVDYTRTYEGAQWLPNDPSGGFSSHPPKVEDDQELVWPESYGIGLAWRYSDEFSIAADAYTTRWSNFKLKTDQGDLNLLAGNDQTADIQDTWQFRIGAEYLWVLPKYVVAARGGFFYDPEPLADEVNDFYGVALGGGFGYRNLVVDAAVQYRWGQDAKWEKVQGVQATTDTSEFMGIVSLIYHFE